MNFPAQSYPDFLASVPNTLCSMLLRPCLLLQANQPKAFSHYSVFERGYTRLEPFDLRLSLACQLRIIAAVLATEY
jgi:hypothetical protein